MIRIIYGWYNSGNPLFGFDNSIIASDVKKSYISTYAENIIKQCRENNYDIYIEENKELLKEIEKQIRLHPMSEEHIHLIYDNGNKFWRLAWNKIDAVIKQAREDKKVGVL